MRRAPRALVLALCVSGLLVAPAQADMGGAAHVPLNTGQEVTQVLGGASGSFTWTVDGSELCYTLAVKSLSVAPFGAHIHPGPRGVAGPVAIPLLTPPATTSSVADCITAAEGGAMTPAELAALVADPGAHYVNVHTSTYTGGEIRGQLK